MSVVFVLALATFSAESTPSALPTIPRRASSLPTATPHKPAAFHTPMQQKIIWLHTPMPHKLLWLPTALPQRLLSLPTAIPRKATPMPRKASSLPTTMPRKALSLPTTLPRTLLSLPKTLPLIPPIVTKGTGQVAAPKGVLERYEAQMKRTHTPAVLTFSYIVEQDGDHRLAQVHRVYRMGNLERDETVAVDAAKVKPRIRIFRNRPNAYAFENVAPRRATYAFTYVGKVHNGTHADYLYRTSSLTPLNPFVVTNVVIDGQSFLPSAVTFRTMSATATGTGVLRYIETAGAWVITEVEASAVSGKTKLREHFAFSDYRFPKTLPASTFGNL